MTKTINQCAVIVAVCASLCGTAFAQETLPKPGPEHAILRSSEGTWDCVVKVGGQESKATSVSKSDLGGFWVTTDFKGEIGGMRYEGHGVDGYDPEKKKFVSVWVDSMSSSMMTFEGTYDEKSKTLTATSEGKGPDGKPTTFKAVTTFTDKEHHVFKMFVVGPDKQEELMMQINYTRKK